MHNNGWGELDEPQRKAVLAIFKDRPVGIELGFAPASSAWAECYRKAYRSYGIVPWFVAANAFAGNNHPTPEQWQAYSAGLRQAGLPKSSLVLPTFEYANFAPNVPQLAHNRVSDRADFQRILAAAGGLAIDSPSGYFFTREPAYRDWVVDALHWARSHGQVSVVIASPHVFGKPFAEHTKKFVQYLRDHAALPDIWVCENYTETDPGKYVNRVGNENVPANVLGTARLMLTEYLAADPAPARPSEIRRPNIIVILTDDQGYADLGVQGQVKDIRTPNLDALAAGGVRCTAGYITAPQCSPSRAGLLTGRYQQRFGFDTIPDCPLPLEETTLADRLQQAGYICGMVGKWHLDPNPTSAKWIARNLPDMAGKPRNQIRIPQSALVTYSAGKRGFQEYFQGEVRRYWANFDLTGKPLQSTGQWVDTAARYRIDVKTEAALAFLARHKADRFFLYLAYMAPHTPLDAPKEYLDRFPGPMPTRRRYALAMQSAIDDGVGRIMARLREYGLEENTLVFYTSDNGAPLHHKRDTPVNTDMGGWDGSLNDPWIGEKGMLTEGGICVPFVVHWKGVLPAGKVYDQPVSSLDIAATAVTAAGQPRDPKLDGVDLLPFLSGKEAAAPHSALFWRFWNQAAVRSGHWKYLQAGTAGEFLFDLSTDANETRNLIGAQPEIGRRLKAELAGWTRQLKPPGLPDRPLNSQEAPWYEQYLGLDAARASRPNVLLIVVDDQGAEMGCLGTPGLSTPNMDALAARGVLFEAANVFCAYPSCSPSRASMLTGVYPHAHRITRNVPEFFGPDAAAWEAALPPIWHQFQVPPSVPTLPKLLKPAGYYTGISHKFHILPHGAFPFDEWISGTPESVEQFIAHAGGQPFFLMHNLAAPHRNFALWVKRAAHIVTPAQVKVPDFLPDVPAVRQDWADYLTAVQYTDEELGRVLAALRRSGQGTNTLIIYTGDNGPAFQRGKASCYPFGLREPLIIAGPGVQGGVKTGALASLVDFAPTILDYAGAPIPGQMQGISLRPLLEQRPGANGEKLIAGEKFGDQAPAVAYQECAVFDGRWYYIRRNHLGKARGLNADDIDEKPWGNRTYAATLAAKGMFPAQYRLLQEWEQGRSPESLFDIQTDFYAVRDLARDPAHAAELQRMRAAMDGWLARTKDACMARGEQLDSGK